MILICMASAFVLAIFISENILKNNNMKRVRISRKWQKIMSCAGQKMVRYIAVGAIFMFSVAGCQSSIDPTWKVYCELYGVNPTQPTIEQENYYYDVWLESDAAYFYMEKQ